MSWILINLSLEKDEYWSVLFARSTLPHFCLRAPLRSIICLWKPETKIQSWEELIKIMGCYYFNINSLRSLSYCCMPSCDDCRPTELDNGVDWMSMWPNTVPESPGKRQVTTGWAPICAYMVEGHGTLNELSGSRMQISAFLHASSIPIAQGSTLPMYHQGVAVASLLGTSVGWKSLVELLCGPGPTALLLRLPVTFLWVKERLLAVKNMLMMWLRPPTVTTKATVELWAIGNSFWATPIWTGFKKKSVSVVSLPPFTFLFFVFWLLFFKILNTLETVFWSLVLDRWTTELYKLIVFRCTSATIIGIHKDKGWCHYNISQSVLEWNHK